MVFVCIIMTGGWISEASYLAEFLQVNLAVTWPKTKIKTPSVVGQRNQASMVDFGGWYLATNMGISIKS